MTIVNNSQISVLLSFNNEKNIDLLPNEHYVLEKEKTMSLRIVPSIDSYIITPKHKSSATYLVIVSDYLLDCGESAVLTLNSECDSMLFGLNYIRVYVNEFDYCKFANYSLKSNTDLEQLYMQRAKYDLKQEQKLDFVDIIPHLGVVGFICFVMLINDFTKTIIALTCLLVCLFLFVCSRLMTLLFHRSKSRFGRQDKSTFFNKSKDDYINEFYNNKDSSK